MYELLLNPEDFRNSRDCLRKYGFTIYPISVLPAIPSTGRKHNVFLWRGPHGSELPYSAKLKEKIQKLGLQASHTASTGWHVTDPCRNIMAVDSTNRKIAEDAFKGMIENFPEELKSGYNLDFNPKKFAFLYTSVRNVAASDLATTGKDRHNREHVLKTASRQAYHIDGFEPGLILLADAKSGKGGELEILIVGGSHIMISHLLTMYRRWDKSVPCDPNFSDLKFRPAVKLEMPYN